MGENRNTAWNMLAEEGDGAHDAYEERFDGDPQINRTNRKRKNGRNTMIEEVLQLHSSDHPGMQLVSVQLNGGNFLNWSRSIKRALGARSKLELLDGTVPQPEINSVYYKAWVKVDYVVSSWIINSISKEVVTAFNHIDSTQKLWAALNHRFNRSNGPKIARLQRDK